MRVQELMTTDVLTTGPEAPLRDVAAILAEHSISGIPVVSERGIVLGVVTEADILCKEQGDPGSHGRIVSLLLDRDRSTLKRKLEATTAGEAMTTPAVTIAPSRPVAAAAALMLQQRVNRLPVVDETAALVGIVTRADLVRAFARPDAEIVREIEDDLVQRTLWLPCGSVRATSVRGEVTLEGYVEHKSEGELLLALVRRVPGVVSVTARITWPHEMRRDGLGPWSVAMAAGFGRSRKGVAR